MPHLHTVNTMTIKDLHKTLTLSLTLSLCIISCNRAADGFTTEELVLINGTDSIMRVLTVADPADSAILRAPSTDLSSEALLSNEYEQLAELMVATVTHPSQDGVGIAGPQVGINRRVVAVQRFDKDPVAWADRLDHPFEVYPNISIVWKSDSLAAGPEGCLSVPDRRGDVMRSQEIVIEYADISNKEAPMIRDTVRGFTSVIFQHEIDHLDGVLYIDRL